MCVCEVWCAHISTHLHMYTRCVQTHMCLYIHAHRFVDTYMTIHDYHTWCQERQAAQSLKGFRFSLKGRWLAALCMCTSAYIYMCIHTNTHMYAYIHRGAKRGVYRCICVYTDAYACIQMHMRVYRRQREAAISWKSRSVAPPQGRARSDHPRADSTRKTWRTPTYWYVYIQIFIRKYICIYI